MMSPLKVAEAVFPLPPAPPLPPTEGEAETTPPPLIAMLEPPDPPPPPMLDTSTPGDWNPCVVISPEIFAVTSPALPPVPPDPPTPRL